MSTCLDAISEVERLRAQRAGGYRDLVVQIGSGEAVDANVIDETLRAANKTPSDLRGDVNHYLRRVAWRAEMDGKQAAEQRMAALQGELAAANQELERAIAAAEQKHREITTPIQHGLSDCRTAFTRAAEAERQLRDTADEKLKANHWQLSSTEQFNRRRSNEAEYRQLERLVSMLAEAKAGNLPGRVGELQKEIDRLTARSRAEAEDRQRESERLQENERRLLEP